MPNSKQCPFCSETIHVDAKKCKHCGEYLDEKLRENNKASDSKTDSDTRLMLEYELKKKSGIIAALLNLVIPGAGYAYCTNWGSQLLLFV